MTLTLLSLFSLLLCLALQFVCVFLGIVNMVGAEEDNTTGGNSGKFG
jgi:hypothetical protein